MKCFECETDAEEIHHHHVVPQSRGGTKTVPLCHSCHAAAHGVDSDWTIAKLTSEALQRKKANSEFTGGHAPFGYRVDDDGVALVEDADEQKVIATIRNFRKDGWPLRGIVAKLDEVGMVGRSGKPLTLTAVARVVGVGR